MLVAHRDHLQRVKDVVGELKARGHESYRLHKTVARPWGAYTVLQEGPGFKIKRIEVKPGAALSLQLHHRRSEHWVVVARRRQGDARRRDTFLVNANGSTYIPVETKHRLENPGSDPLVMIEVQCGDYLGEDDIVRFDDQVRSRAGPRPSAGQADTSGSICRSSQAIWSFSSSLRRFRRVSCSWSCAGSLDEPLDDGIEVAMLDLERDQPLHERDAIRVADVDHHLRAAHGTPASRQSMPAAGRRTASGRLVMPTD